MTPSYKSFPRTLLVATLLAAGFACARSPETPLEEAPRAPSALVPLSPSAAAPRANARIKSQCAEGKAAFETYFYQPILRARCVECHGDNPTYHGPPHSVANVDQAYAMVFSLMNFDVIPISPFVKKGGNNHCDDIYSYPCDTSAADLTEAAKLWWENGQKLCPDEFVYQTAPVVIPANLPQGPNDFMDLKVPLDSIGSSLKGAWFEIRVQHYNDALRFVSPRLHAANRALEIQGIRITYEGLGNPQTNAFEGVVQGVRANDPAPPVLSTAAAIFPISAIAADPIGKSLAFQFRILKPTESELQCAALDTFKAKVLPTLKANACLTCHDPAAAALPAPFISGASKLNLTGSEAQVCSAMRGRIYWRDTHTSPALGMVIGSKEHPIQVAPFEILPNWIDWFEEEKLFEYP